MRVTRKEYNELPERLKEQVTIIKYQVYANDTFINEFEDQYDVLKFVKDCMNDNTINRMVIYL